MCISEVWQWELSPSTWTWQSVSISLSFLGGVDDVVCQYFGAER